MARLLLCQKRAHRPATRQVRLPRPGERTGRPFVSLGPSPSIGRGGYVAVARLRKGGRLGAYPSTGRWRLLTRAPYIQFSLISARGGDSLTTLAHLADFRPRAPHARYVADSWRPCTAPRAQ